VPQVCRAGLIGPGGIGLSRSLPGSLAPYDQSHCGTWGSGSRHLACRPRSLVRVSRRVHALRLRREGPARDPEAAHGSAGRGRPWWARLPPCVSDPRPLRPLLAPSPSGPSRPRPRGVPALSGRPPVPAAHPVRRPSAGRSKNHPTLHTSPQGRGQDEPSSPHPRLPRARGLLSDGLRARGTDSPCGT
jgi:hypothetical protein